MDMKVITKRQIILGVRDRWLEQYKHYADHYPVGWSENLTAGEIRGRLAALDLTTCTSADVDEALQVKRWADNTCDFCDEDHEVILRIGDEPGYDSQWVDLCKGCLDKASSILK